MINTFCKYLLLFVSLIAVLNSAEDQYKIGVLLGFTGNGQLNAIESKTAVDLAVKDINTYFAGQNKNIKIIPVFADTKSNPDSCILRVRQLADSGVRVMIGVYMNTELRAIKHIIDSLNILLVSHSAVISSLALANDNIFRLVPSVKMQVKSVAQLMLEDGKKVIIPLCRSDVWGNDLKNALKAELDTNKIKMMNGFSYESRNADYSTIMKQVNSEISELRTKYRDNEICVYMVTYSEGTEILRQTANFTELKDIKFYGSSSFSGNQNLLTKPDAFESAINTKLECPIMGFDDVLQSKWEPVKKLIRAQIGTEPNIYALTIYDALEVTSLAYAAVGKNASISDLKNSFINEANGYLGVSGVINLDENGDRQNVNYDFWGVKMVNGAPEWYRSASYNTKTEVVTRR